MRKVFIHLTVWYLSFWSLIVPSTAHASMVAHFRCAEIPNQYWNPNAAKSYAKAIMKERYNWGRKQYLALVELWTIESHWDVKAFNQSVDRWTNKHAGGIPQLLSMNPVTTPAPQQVERGLAYIRQRYGTPVRALAFHKYHSWY